MIQCIQLDKKCIYIPVWLDQKEFYKKIIIPRFAIYIPVWLDQKVCYYIKAIYIAVIYIPVWLDQKVKLRGLLQLLFADLHSSMVRLESSAPMLNLQQGIKFTFQYGQIRKLDTRYQFLIFPYIYIPVWLDQKAIGFNLLSYLIVAFTFQYGQIRKVEYQDVGVESNFDLHSSMVRLESVILYRVLLYPQVFTFQYGQIRKQIPTISRKHLNRIYIPVWLDQKGLLYPRSLAYNQHLHSSMVRLESII